MQRLPLSAETCGNPLPARAAASAIRGCWFDRWGDVLGGAVVATVGLAVMAIGV